MKTLSSIIAIFALSSLTPAFAQDAADTDQSAPDAAEETAPAPDAGNPDATEESAQAAQATPTKESAQSRNTWKEYSLSAETEAAFRSKQRNGTIMVEAVPLENDGSAIIASVDQEKSVDPLDITMDGY